MIRNLAIFFLSFMAAEIIACSSGKLSVKPAPGETGWEICPSCEGTGIIETCSARPGQEGARLTDGGKKSAGSCVDILFPSMSFVKKAGPDEYVKYEYDETGALKVTRKDGDIDPRHGSNNTGVESSYVKRSVTCERCGGRGWIRADEGIGYSMDREQKMEGFDRANDLINKK